MNNSRTKFIFDRARYRGLRGSLTLLTWEELKFISNFEAKHPEEAKRIGAYKSIADMAKACGMELKPDPKADAVVDVMTGKRMYEDTAD